MRNFYVCSVGEPDSDYVEANLQRIISNSAYHMHQDTTQRGLYDEIKVGDVLILKYNRKYIAYGESTGIITTNDEEWNQSSPVKEWFFYNKENPKEGISSYGVQVETLEGSGQMGTVKGITSNFGFSKLSEINQNNIFYKKLNTEKLMKKTEDIKQLLYYKKQIILQGPPGTGKTRFAKQIANSFLNPNFAHLSPLDLIESFFKEGKSDEEYNREFFDRIQEFYDLFPKNKFLELQLDDFCIGKGNNINFCWWVEVGLKKYGKFTPGQSGNYVIYYSKSKSDYVQKYNGTIEENLTNINLALRLLIEEQNVSKANELFGDSFIIKVLHSYFPDKYFPINGRQSLVNALNIFGEDSKKKSTLDLNLILQDIFNGYKSDFPSSITSLDFMRFLFKNFNLKEDGTLNSLEETPQLYRTPTIIQFHPSYTYEDFVRGISSTTTEMGIEYKVENKILAELAKEALENPYLDYVLIIDEINRANLSSVLGELIYAMEYRYCFNGSAEEQKASKVESPYTLEDKYLQEKTRELCLPENLYIIGTMNTADRSVGHIDYAIQRRFAFVDLLPQELNNDDSIVFHEELFKKISLLFVENYDEYISNDKIPLKRAKTLSQEFRVEDVWLGHSYFIQKIIDEGTLLPQDFRIRIDYEIKPILLQYEKDGILIGDYEGKSVKDYIKSL